MKDITKITGYVRGGCSPLGMKKPYPVVFDASAGEFEEIYVSGGRIGLTLKVPLADLLKVMMPYISLDESSQTSGNDAGRKKVNK